MTDRGPVLAFDFASPVASAAVARRGELLASLERARSNGADDDLLRLVEEVLAAAGVRRRELAGVLALRGPGSFTGTRIACATALGLAQALTIPATGVSNLEGLALLAPAGDRVVLAAIDALRGDWYLQRFENRTAIAEARIDRPAPRLWSGVDAMVGFDLHRFAAGQEGPLPACIDASGLAAAVAIHGSRERWSFEIERLSRPLYLRPPATRASS